MLLATNAGGSGYSLPAAISGASAHPPQAPVWLDPTGCPPGRVFYFRPANPVRLRDSAAALDKNHLFHNILRSHPKLIRECASASVLFLAGSFMTHRTDEAPRREVIARWCTLAEQRLNYLTEMFESGRWRRFYTEVAFLENIKEAKFAVETWRGLSNPHLARTAAIEPTPELAQGVAAVELALSESA